MSTPTSFPSQNASIDGSRIAAPDTFNRHLRRIRGSACGDHAGGVGEVVGSGGRRPRCAIPESDALAALDDRLRAVVVIVDRAEEFERSPLGPSATIVLRIDQKRLERARWARDRLDDLADPRNGSRALALGTRVRIEAAPVGRLVGGVFRDLRTAHLWSIRKYPPTPTRIRVKRLDRAGVALSAPDACIGCAQ